MSSRFYARHWRNLVTVSKASVYEDSGAAAAGAKGSRGALFWISRAIWNILRKTEEYLSLPKDTEWKDNAFLLSTSENQLTRNTKKSHEPETDCSAAQILNSLVLDRGLAIRQKYDYRGSIV